MGEGPVGTLLVPGLGGGVGIAQARDATINRISDTNQRDFKNFFIMILLIIFLAFSI